MTTLVPAALPRSSGTAITASRWWSPLGITVAASVVLGGLTSWAQGFLPDALSSFANSISGWTVVTAVIVATLRPRPSWAAVLGVVSFVALVLGYTWASALRGLYYDPLLWSLIGVVGGPFVGAAAAAVVRPGRRGAAIGSGLLAGVLVGDALHGLTVVADTTSPVYWTLLLVIAVALVGTVARARLRTARLVGLQLAATALATGGVVGFMLM